MSRGEASRENGKKGGRPKGALSKTTIARKRGEERALQQAEITAERTMMEIARVAFTQRTSVFEDGRLKPLDEWTPDEAALLEGFEVIIKNAQAGDGHLDTVHKVRLARKMEALDILAKHFGITTNKVEISGKLSLEDLIVAADAAE